LVVIESLDAWIVLWWKNENHSHVVLMEWNVLIEWVSCSFNRWSWEL